MDTTSRPAPRRRMPPEERERAIVEAATELALADGLDALTVRSVAARVGVTPALVSHYRPVMDDFVAEVFGAIVAAEREEVLAGFEPSGGLRSSLLHLIETLLDGSRDDVTLIWVQSWALGARNEALGARVRHEMDLWQTGLEAAIARADAEGVGAPDGRDAGDDRVARVDPASAAWVLLAMVDGMSAHALVTWAPRDRADLARRTLAAVLHRTD